MVLAWAEVGRGNWEAVGKVVEEHSLPQGDYGVPEFQKMSPSRTAQFAYMRGRLSESQGNKAAALVDYYRAFTLGFGQDRELSGDAMLRAMAILAEDENLTDDKSKLKEMHAMALQYKNAYGGGSVPEEFAEYAVAYGGDDAAEVSGQEGAGEAEGEAPSADAGEAAGAEGGAEAAADAPASEAEAGAGEGAPEEPAADTPEEPAGDAEPPESEGSEEGEADAEEAEADAG